jgi:hypothetical protein
MTPHCKRCERKKNDFVTVPNPLSGTFDVAGATSLFRSQVTNYSSPVREFGTRGPHLPLMQQLIARDICLWFTQFVTKLPDGDASRGEFRGIRTMVIFQSSQPPMSRFGSRWMM